MNDQKQFLISVSDSYLGTHTENKDVLGHDALNNFLLRETVITLCAVEEKQQIQFHNEVSSANKRFIVFYKLKPCVLKDEHFLELIQVAYINGPPAASLYHTLQNVFTPLLVKQDKRSASHTNIQRQIANLQTGLRNAALAPATDDSNTLSVISSLDHEVDYWNNVAGSSRNNQRTGAAFRDILQPLARDFNVLDALPLTEIEDLLENAHNVLDDLWRYDPPYSKFRIQHLMDLIASEVVKCVSKNLSVDIWSKDFNQASELLQQCLSVLKHWELSCKQLTTIFWPNYSIHPWSGEPYVPQQLVELILRLQEVFNARVMHRQLVRLLTSQEQEDLKTDNMFEPFKGLDILECGLYTETAWQTANKKYEYMLEPAENLVASKLKTQLSQVNANTRQLLYEFGRYAELINRPIVKQSLLTERQYLLTSLKDYTNQLANQLSSDASPVKYDVSQTINDIVMIRQLEAKAIDIQSTSKKLLDDLSASDELNQMVDKLLKDIKQQHNEMFESWTSEVIAKINNKLLSLRETDPVVQFSSNKMMKVNYSPQLVTLIREVRQLTALGYNIPKNIQEISNHAKQFMKHAKILEQIANFHNTIGNKMIPSQRPMMLASALELSKLVQEQEVVSWGDVQSVEKYVQNLKAVVEKLSAENNLLAAYHLQVMEKINALADTDLIKYYQKWKDTARNLRDIVAQVEYKGFESTQSWKTDIDQQLCKVLEVQYLKSLDSLHLYLPEIHADLVYRDAMLQFTPPKETLRERYQQQLKRFLEIPRSFRGVSDFAKENVFAEIVERNKDNLTNVNKHTDELMEQLDGVIKYWQSWLSLETLDTTQLTSWEHWDLHFRASKTFGQEIAKLPSTEERVGCFIIGLSWLRSDLESHNRSYWSQLSSSLKDSIAQDVFKLQQYVDTSTATLNRQPLSLDQIGDADASHADVIRQKPQMESLYKEMYRKSTMLAGWNRERVDSVKRLIAAWERLLSLLDNYEHIIAKQVETMKTTLNVTSENLQNDVERFAAKWEQVRFKPHTDDIQESLQNLQKHLENIKEKRQELDELVTRKEKLLGDYERFNMAHPEFAMLEDTVHEIEQQEKLWKLFEEFNTDMEKLSNEEWIVFRKKSYRLEEFLKNWLNKLEKTENTPVITKMLQEIHKYQVATPVLKYVKGDDFTEKHWIEVLTLLGITPKPIDILTLGDFLNVSETLADHAKQLQTICKRAASEVIVRQALGELDQWDVQCRFVLTTHIDSHGKNVMLIKDFKEILNKIGDNQSLLQSVKSSSDYDSFSERAELWETRLADLDHYLTSLAQIQRRWIYLEPIFGGGTLEQERQRFDRLDKDFKYLLTYIDRDTRVTALSRYPNVRSVLQNLQDQLSRCQNSLDNFLTEKRNKFPRFLFLGDDDLLEVIGQSSKEEIIQTHLKKIFAGIHSISLDLQNKNIDAICSIEGEVVPLHRSVNIDQPVEDWLNVLVGEMQDSLRQLLKDCLADGQNVDPLKYPSQILCLADSIIFTTKCEQAIGNMSLSSLLSNYKGQLNHYSSLEFNDPNPNIGDSNVMELKLKALLLDTIHHIAVIEDLIQANVVKVNDWNWQKQLRYYVDSSDNVTVKMVNAEMDYSFEYLGNQAKLVRTPLTDKCFLTLSQGMQLGMGGNPYGPAGTGKTESVKALGSLLGRQVLVFNCDEGIDAASLGRILSGLVRSGAWGCFDEFNRLDEATLSAVSMYIQPVQNALRMSLNKVMLLGQEIKVNQHCGIFITLNPAGGSYGGRNKLPDSLKQLFRPVVMTHPDHEQIATTLLHCDGYKNANNIGRKLIETFSCANKLLSKQQHYDWGLRSLRTVLSGCSRNIRQLRKKMPPNDITHQMELELVVKALRMDTLSKLTHVDGVKFDALIQDVFPGITNGSFNDDELRIALEETCGDLGYIINKRQINKCLELNEQLEQRMGVTIVGPPNSGKSTLRTLLFNALLRMGRLVKQHVFNPKAMPRNQLLGQIDLDTRQWTDGVLTLYSLQVTSEPLDIWSWIVCDGDIDPEWVESLNSVLDDNKLLTLPSGWRIQFGPNVNFVFETHDLSYASPATISRLGIVFLSEEDINIADIVSTFIYKQPDNIQGVLEHYTNDYFYKGVEWIANELESVSKVSITLSGLSFLDSIANKSEFTVALLNGLGGYLNENEREVFAQNVFEWTSEVQPPASSLYRYNETRNMIESYASNITAPNFDKTANDLPLVLTPQTCHSLDCLRNWLKPGKEQHFLLVGPHGSAKTLILEYLIQERSNIDMMTVHCSANLSPRHVIQKLAQFCIVVSSNKGHIYKPKKGHLVIHFKNMHLLKCDMWNTNMLVAFLQQLMNYNGFFDSNLDWVGVENVTLVGSLINTNGLSTRFTSAMHIFNINLPSLEDLNIIYTLYLSSLLKKCAPNSTWPNSKTVKLTTTMILIYNEIKNNFPPVQEQFYSFNPHDVTKWCKSFLRYKNEIEADPDRSLLEMLCYEAQRLFKDRLVNENNHKTFENVIIGAVHKEWGKVDVLKKTENSFYVPGIRFKSSDDTPPLTKFTHEEWTNTVKKGLIQYEREGENLNVVIIRELLDLTAAAVKTLTEPQGNLFLIGHAGVGRKTSVKIISALQSAKLVIPVTSKQPQFNNDLKTAMQYAGIEGEDVYLLLEDHTFQANLTDIINALLCSGEVPGLYTTTELDASVAVLKDEANESNFDGSLTEFFTERIKNKLHIITCLEFNNSDLPKILERCPALYQNCHVIWSSSWSKGTMDQIPAMLIEKIAKEDEKEKEIKIRGGFSEIHSSVKPEIAAPIRFVSLIKLYADIYHEKKTTISAKQKKLDAGVNKLTEAQNVVTELKQKATAQEKKLAEKQTKANSALDMISNTMKSANTQKQEMETLKQHTEKESLQLTKRKKEIELELSEVKPLIEEARAAVGNIKTEALSELRSLRAPPDIIRDILEGVLRLMGTQDTSWNSMKNFLSKRGVKEDIKSFDASRISPENRQAVERLMSHRSDSFDPKNAKRASVAAAPLAGWVTANVRYSLVLDKIRPLEREQNKLKQNLNNSELQLEELGSALSDVDSTVAKLKEQLSKYTKEAAEIEIHLNAAQNTLQAAEGLVEKLKDEFNRWQTQLKELSEELEGLPRNCLLAAASITYLSGESENNRLKMLNEWQKLLNIENFSLESFLSSEREQLQWQSEGLPADRLSIQNAAIILNTKLCPLLIDPTSTSVEWYKMHVKQKTVEVLPQNYPKFIMALELAIRFGKTLIIEDIDTIPPVLFSILRRQFVYQGERKLININGKLIDFHNDFQLILSSRNVFIQIPADVTTLVSVINFATTQAGLSEQLLISAIKQENPELEERRKNLLQQREELQEKQEKLQDQLLEELSQATGDILQNKNLMESLNKTKESSKEIAEALRNSNTVHEKLQAEYQIYKDISQFGSALYFAVDEMSATNIFYSLSISAFTRFFLKSLPLVMDLNGSTAFLQKNLIQALYIHMSKGIFKEDRLKFALHLCHKMLPRQIPESEWNFFLDNSFGSAKQDAGGLEASWIPDISKGNVFSLQATFPDLYSTLQLNNEGPWRKFMESSDCKTAFPPHCQITEFQKVLVVQTLRKDMLHSALTLCILHLTGLQNLNSDILQLSSVTKETLSHEPILLLTTPGTDPSSEIIKVAQSRSDAVTCNEIAMGEGQEDTALSALHEAAKSGQWLILKNLHLVTCWLPTLCQSLQNLQPDKHFRLWLVTEPHELFSSVLAQNCLKIVYEIPKGVKNNLLQTYTTWGLSYVESLNPTGCRIFFVLACIHAILQERRTYIPQGWSKPYEFNDVDFSTILKLTVEMWKSQTTGIQWKYLIGLCLDAVYGGRIEKLQDLAILESYLRQYFVDDVLSHRWKPFRSTASLPTYSNYEEYLNVIRQLSDKDLPYYFGLPENIDRAWEKNMSAEIISSLRDLNVMKNKNEKIAKEKLQKQIAPYLMLWKKLNQGYDFIRISNPVPITEGSALAIFISEEYCGAIILIQQIHKCFATLNKITKGSIVPGEKELIITNELICHQTPKAWLNLWNGPKDPSKYLKNIIIKASKISKWKNESADMIFKQPFNLSFTFYPETFLTAFKQDYSRKMNIPIDELVLKSGWKHLENSNAIVLTGLLIEGALFDGYTLSPCPPNFDSISAVPNCYISWVKKEQVVNNEKVIEVPLYYTLDREELFGYLQVPGSFKERDTWIQAGLSFFIMY